jgi:hypothetical protein
MDKGTPHLEPLLVPYQINIQVFQTTAAVFQSCKQMFSVTKGKVQAIQIEILLFFSIGDTECAPLTCDKHDIYGQQTKGQVV